MGKLVSIRNVENLVKALKGPWNGSEALILWWGEG